MLDKSIKADIQKRTPPGWYGLASPSGWDDIVSDLHTAFLKIDPDYEVNQIKSKFGGLRYYSSLMGNKEAEVLTRAAEQASYVTCELCGATGSMWVCGNWYSTLCDSCVSGDTARKYEKCESD